LKNKWGRKKVSSHGLTGKKKTATREQAIKEGREKTEWEIETD